MKKANKIITTKEAAEILGVTRSRVSILLKNGRIGTREKGISYDLVMQYKKNRKHGRPEGIYGR